MWAFYTIFGVCLFAAGISMLIKEDLRVHELEMHDKLANNKITKDEQE